MKIKSLLTIGIAFTTLAFVSCRKDRVCQCTKTYSDGSTSMDSYTIHGSTIAGVPGTGQSKKSQQAQCEGDAESNSGYTKTCVLLD